MSNAKENTLVLNFVIHHAFTTGETGGGDVGGMKDDMLASLAQIKLPFAPSHFFSLLLPFALHDHLSDLRLTRQGSER